MTWPDLAQDVECLCFTFSVCPLTKGEMKKYGILFCVSLLETFTMNTLFKIQSLLIVSFYWGNKHLHTIKCLDCIFLLRVF
jgi:hypothetical protein